MEAVKRLDRNTIRVSAKTEVRDDRHVEHHIARLHTAMAVELSANAPGCASCSHKGLSVERVAPSYLDPFRDEHIMTAFCQAGHCITEQEKQMAISSMSIFDAGWSTSTPGDMKNPMGVPTKFAKPAKSAAEIFSETLGALPRTEFDLDFAGLTKTAGGFGAVNFYDIRPKGKSVEDFQREYMTSFGPDPARLNPEPVAPAPTIDRDTPEGSLEAAW